jgi:hypothetical protein
VASAGPGILACSWLDGCRSLEDWVVSIESSDTAAWKVVMGEQAVRGVSRISVLVTSSSLSMASAMVSSALTTSPCQWSRSSPLLRSATDDSDSDYWTLIIRRRTSSTRRPRSLFQLDVCPPLDHCYICLSVKSSHHLSRRYDELFIFHLGMAEQTTRYAIMDPITRTGEAA